MRPQRPILAAAMAAAIFIAGAASWAAPTRILLCVESSGLPSIDRYLDSLESALGASDSAVAALRGDGLEAPRDEAARRSCALFLSVMIAADSGTDSVAWSYASPIVQTGNLVSGRFEKPEPRDGDLASYFWTEAVAGLPQAIEALPEEKIRISGEPGLIVEGFGEPLTIPLEGEAEPKIGLPSFVEWRASSPKALAESGSVLLSSPGALLEIPYRRLPRWSLDLGLRDLSFIEAGANLALGRRLFARAALTEFFAGLSLKDYSGPPPKPPLLEFSSAMRMGIGCGYYFIAPERAIRAYAALDAFLRLGSAPAIGMGAYAGAEWRASPRGRLFLELGAELLSSAARDFAFPRSALGWRFDLEPRKPLSSGT